MGNIIDNIKYYSITGLKFLFINKNNFESCFIERYKVLIANQLISYKSH